MINCAFGKRYGLITIRHVKRGNKNRLVTIKRLLKSGVKFLEATSQHTDNSIFACQNEEFLLKCQLAQRNEYSHAKRDSRIKSTVTLIFTICSIVASIVDCDTLSAISNLFAVGLVVFNKYSDGHISTHKKHAASIQQYIDVTLLLRL